MNVWLVLPGSLSMRLAAELTTYLPDHDHLHTETHHRIPPWRWPIGDLSSGLRMGYFYVLLMRKNGDRQERGLQLDPCSHKQRSRSLADQRNLTVVGKLPSGAIQLVFSDSPAR